MTRSKLWKRASALHSRQRRLLTDLQGGDGAIYSLFPAETGEGWKGDSDGMKSEDAPPLPDLSDTAPRAPRRGQLGRRLRVHPPQRPPVPQRDRTFPGEAQARRGDRRGPPGSSRGRGDHRDSTGARRAPGMHEMGVRTPDTPAVVSGREAASTVLGRMQAGEGPGARPRSRDSRTSLGVRTVAAETSTVRRRRRPAPGWGRVKARRLCGGSWRRRGEGRRCRRKGHGSSPLPRRCGA